VMGTSDSGLVSGSELVAPWVGLIGGCWDSAMRWVV